MENTIPTVIAILIGPTEDQSFLAHTLLCCYRPVLPNGKFSLSVLYSTYIYIDYMTLWPIYKAKIKMAYCHYIASKIKLSE